MASWLFYADVQIVVYRSVRNTLVGGGAHDAPPKIEQDRMILPHRGAKSFRAVEGAGPYTLHRQTTIFSSDQQKMTSRVGGHFDVINQALPAQPRTLISLWRTISLMLARAGFRYSRGSNLLG